MSTSGQRKLNKFLSNTKCNVLVMCLKIRVNDNPSIFMPVKIAPVFCLFCFCCIFYDHKSMVKKKKKKQKSKRAGSEASSHVVVCHLH